MRIVQLFTWKMLLPGVLALIVASCGTIDVGIVTELPSTATLAPAVSPTSPETSPTAPSGQPGETQAPEAEKTLEPAASQTPAAAPGAPELAWLPFSAGNQENGEVLVRRGDRVAPERVPAEIQISWDYSPQSGRLAYGSRFWEAAQGSSWSVTNLAVYDFTTGTWEEWLADNVIRAEWLPAGVFSEERLVASVFNPQTGLFELVFVNRPGEAGLITECASPQFSTSPSGDRIAFVTFPDQAGGNQAGDCAGTYVVDLSDFSVRRVSDFGSEPLESGWVGDQPLWAEAQGTLIYPDAPFWVVPLDGTSAFVPGTAGEVDPNSLPRPELSLWSDSHHQLVSQACGGMLDPMGVSVYRLSADLSEIEEHECLGGRDRGSLVLVDWWVPGESVLLLERQNGSPDPWGEPVVWSLKEERWLEFER